jgi:copper chaperone CopZ
MAGLVTRLVEWATGETLPEATYNHINDNVSGSLRRAVNKAVENDLVTVYPNKAFYPRRDATRLELAESLYLLNQFLDGDFLADAIGLFVHIAQVEVNFASGTVDLTVDSKARDLATLAQLIERTKSENQNPAKMLMVNRESGSTDDTKFPWDYHAGSGSIPKASMAARHNGPLPKGRPDVNPTWFTYVNGANSDPYKRWQIIPVVAAGKGSVSRTEIRAFDRFGRPLAIPFHVGVYQLYITELSMPYQPFQPGAFDRDPEDSLAGFDPSAAVLWGQQGQRAGYWPGLESEGNPVTGILIDEGTWQFQLPEGENVLWVAFYAEVNAYFQGRFYHGVQ